MRGHDTTTANQKGFALRGFAQTGFVWKGLAATFGLGLLLAGCGSDLPNAEIQSAGSSPHTKRFSSDDITAVYSEDTFQTGTLTRPTITRHFKDPSEAPALAQEFGDFNTATEVKAYLFLNQDPTFLAPARFIVAMEAVSGWARIQGADGKPLFSEAYTIDQAGNRIPDKIDGEFDDGNEQTHFGRFKIPVAITRLTADMRIHTAQTGDVLTAFLENEREIRAPFVGTVVEPKDFRIAIELYPYRKGFLTYAVNAAEMRQFSDTLPPEVLSAQVDAILNWMHTKLLGQAQDVANN